MKIIPFTFTCSRDLDCLAWLVRSARDLGDKRLGNWIAMVDPAEHAIAPGCDVMMREPGFAPWSDRSAAVKLDGFRRILERGGLSDSDYVLHVDSDCVFYSAKALDLLDGQVDLIGARHTEPRRVFGAPWAWVGGAFMATKVGKLKTVLMEPLKPALDLMRKEGLGDLIPHDDVVISFLFHLVGASVKDASPLVRTGDLEAVVLNRETPPSVLHYGSDTRDFLGVANCPKWNFPRIVKRQKDAGG